MNKLVEATLTIIGAAFLIGIMLKVYGILVEVYWKFMFNALGLKPKRR